MNRPKLADYCIIADEYRYNEYVNDLEKYCDALERALDRTCALAYLNGQNKEKSGLKDE